MSRIAIIGAGMAGLSCGEQLAAAGHDVRLFDKGRGPGGRMATRRAEVDGETLRFDHGAQYFTVRDPAFAERVARWEEDGVVDRWPLAGDDAYVGTPGMNAPVRAMAHDLDASFSKRVERIERRDCVWSCLGEDWGETGFDAIVVALPAEQAAPMLAPHDAALESMAANTASAPCWTVMVRFAAPFDHVGTLRDASAIGWAARNSAKPERDGGECWVIQADPDWSATHLERDPDGIAPALLSAFADAIERPLPAHDHLAAHRWRYARSGKADRNYLWNDKLKLGVCGDWLLGPRVECAFLSGHRLGKAMA